MEHDDWRERFQNARPSTNPIDVTRPKPGTLREAIAVFSEHGLFLGTITVDRTSGNSVMWIGLRDVVEDRIISA